MPDFEYPAKDSDARVIVYRSPRRRCALAEGRMPGVAQHFNEELSITQSRCMHRGDYHYCCELSSAV